MFKKIIEKTKNLLGLNNEDGKQSNVGLTGIKSDYKPYSSMFTSSKDLLNKPVSVPRYVNTSPKYIEALTIKSQIPITTGRLENNYIKIKQNSNTDNDLNTSFISNNNIIDLGKMNQFKINDNIFDNKTLTDVNNKIVDYVNQKISEKNEMLPENPIPNPQFLFGDNQTVNIIDYEKVMEKYNIPNKIKKLEEILTEMEAVSSIFDDLIKAEEENVGVNQSVKEKRIDILNRNKNKNLDILKLKYQLAKDNYERSLDLAKDELNLARTEQKDIISNTKQMIQQLISTGAIVDLNDDDLNQLSLYSNYPVKILKSIRSAVKSGNEAKTQKLLNDLSIRSQYLDLAQKRFELSKQKSAQKQIQKTTKTVNVDNIIKYLADNNLPITAVSQNGDLNKSFLNRIIQNGVPLNVANGIWENIKSGNSLEVIRAGMESEGLDSTYLDKFIAAMKNENKNLILEKLKNL